MLLPSPAQFPVKDYWTLSAGFAPEISSVRFNWPHHQSFVFSERIRQRITAALGQQATGAASVVQAFKQRTFNNAYALKPADTAAGSCAALLCVMLDQDALRQASPLAPWAFPPSTPAATG